MRFLFSWTLHPFASGNLLKIVLFFLNQLSINKSNLSMQFYWQRRIYNMFLFTNNSYPTKQISPSQLNLQITTNKRGATSATPERSFSLLRRLKTWQRSMMTKTRFNSLSLLNNNQAILDKISFIDVANEFVNVQPTRFKHVFGNFSEKDL